MLLLTYILNFNSFYTTHVSSLFTKFIYASLNCF